MKRRTLTPAIKRLVLERYDHRCGACRDPFGPELIEFDHILPLALGGADEPGNLQPLHPACHKEKTAQDLKRIAKADRMARVLEEGRGRKRRGPPLESKPFDKRFRRRLDGTVERRGLPNAG